jgi:hypothetical protein
MKVRSFSQGAAACGMEPPSRASRPGPSSTDDRACWTPPEACLNSLLVIVKLGQTVAFSSPYMTNMPSFPVRNGLRAPKFVLLPK